MMQDEGLSKLKVFRVIRLMRMLKLVRLVRASRIIARWEATINLSNATKTLLRSTVILMLGAHWMACTWGYIGREISNEQSNDNEQLRLSWIDILAQNKDAGMPVSAHVDMGTSVYVAGIHFAVMTITSIGYGDIVPNQPEEYILGGICQLIGGLIWASCIGSICALLTTSNPAAVRFRQTMDELNLMMASRGMNSDDQAELRMFFINAKSQREAQAQRSLLTEMSPMVRADTAGKFFGNQVRSVWYFRAASDGFISAVALALQTEVYTSGEAVDVEAKLGIVNRGLILWNAMVKR